MAKDELRPPLEILLSRHLLYLFSCVMMLYKIWCECEKIDCSGLLYNMSSLRSSKIQTSIFSLLANVYWSNSGFISLGRLSWTILEWIALLLWLPMYCYIKKKLTNIILWRSPPRVKSQHHLTMDVRVLQQKEVWVYPEGMGPSQQVATGARRQCMGQECDGARWRGA